MRRPEVQRADLIWRHWCHNSPNDNGGHDVPRLRHGDQRGQPGAGVHPRHLYQLHGTTDTIRRKVVRGRAAAYTPILSKAGVQRASRNTPRIISGDAQCPLVAFCSQRKAFLQCDQVKENEENEEAPLAVKQ